MNTEAIETQAASRGAQWTKARIRRELATMARPAGDLETKSVGIEIVACYRGDFALLTRWKRWLSRNHSANWATTDAICGALIGPLLEDQTAGAPRGHASHSSINVEGDTAGTAIVIMCVARVRPSWARYWSSRSPVACSIRQPPPSCRHGRA